MKQAIIVRRDLKMDKGKLAVQVAHASLSSALLVQKKSPKIFREWIDFGQKKITLKAENTAELRELKKRAASLRIQSVMIKDAGLTQLSPGTTTALGIGPAENEKIDRIIGELQLL